MNVTLPGGEKQTKKNPHTQSDNAQSLALKKKTKMNHDRWKYWMEAVKEKENDVWLTVFGVVVMLHYV